MLSTRIRALFSVWLGGTFDCVAIIPVVTTMPGGPTTLFISRSSRPLTWMRTVRAHSKNIMQAPSLTNSDPDPSTPIAHGVRGGVRSHDKRLRLPVLLLTTTKTTSRHRPRGLIRSARMLPRSLAAVDRFRWPVGGILRRGAPRLRPHGVIFSRIQSRAGRRRCCQTLMLVVSDHVAHVKPPKKLFWAKKKWDSAGWRGNATEHKLWQKTTEVNPHPCTGLGEGGGNHCSRAAAPA